MRPTSSINTEFTLQLLEPLILSKTNNSSALYRLQEPLLYNNSRNYYTVAEPGSDPNLSLQESAEGVPPYPHWLDCSGAGGELQVPPRTHHWQTEIIHPQTVWWRRHNSASSTSGGWRNWPWHLKPSQTFTDTQLRVSLPGTATAPQGSPEGVAVCPTHHRGRLPALQDTYTTRRHRKAKNIIKDNNHPGHCQKARSIQVHQSWDQETEKQLQSFIFPLFN